MLGDDGDHIEGVVSAVVRGMMSSPEAIADGARTLIEERRKNITTRANARKSAQQKLTRAQARFDKALLKNLDGEIDDDEWLRLKAGIDGDLKAAKAEQGRIGVRRRQGISAHRTRDPVNHRERIEQPEA
jgi:hypothetical protein